MSFENRRCPAGWHSFQPTPLLGVLLRAPQGNPPVAGYSTAGRCRGQHLHPSVSCDALAHCVVTWADDTDGNGFYQVLAELFDETGKASRAEWTVNRVPSGQQTSPVAGLSGAGALMVVWEDDMDNNGYRQILARGY